MVGIHSGDRRLRWAAELNRNGGGVSPGCNTAAPIGLGGGRVVKGASGFWALFFWTSTLCLLACSSVTANPCSVDFFVGRHVLSGSPQAKVQIASEKIDLGVTYERFKDLGFVGVTNVGVAVDYVFVNSAEQVDLVMGFPIGAASGESRVADFAVSGAGVGPLLPSHQGVVAGFAQSTDLSLCERGLYKIGGGEEVKKLPIEPPRIQWFMWRQRFAPGTTSVRLTYRQSALDGAMCRFHYFLQTARYWGNGRIGDFEVTLRESGARRRGILELNLSGGELVRKKRTRRWRFREFDPSNDIVLQLAECGG